MPDYRNKWEEYHASHDRAMCLFLSKELRRRGVTARVVPRKNYRPYVQLYGTREKEDLIAARKACEREYGETPSIHTKP